MKLETVELFNYLRINMDLCDKWTLEFLDSIEEKVAFNAVTRKQYFLLLKKSKEMYVSKNLSNFHQAIKGSTDINQDGEKLLKLI